MTGSIFNRQALSREAGSKTERRKKAWCAKMQEAKKKVGQSCMSSKPSGPHALVELGLVSISASDQ